MAAEQYGAAMRILTMLVLWVVAVSAYGHGGGLDADGCHTKRSTGDYHCHRGQAPASGRQSQPPQRFASTSDSQTCHIGPRGGRYRIVNGRKRYDC